MWDKAKDAANTVGDLAGDAADAVWDAANTVGDLAGDAADAVWDAAENAVDAVVDGDTDDASWDAAVWVEVGGAMMIPSRDIVDNAVKADNVTTLVAAVKAAWLVDTLKSEGPFTVFAPINDAFDALPAGTVEDLLKEENKPTLTSILTYHVVSGSYTAADLSDGMTLTSVQGEDLTITYENDMWKVNGVDIIIADIISSNGVTHAVGTVLMPANPAPAADDDMAEAKEWASGLVAIETDTSMLEWTGRAAGKSHNGVVDIKSWNLKLDNGNIVAGEFVIDMSTIDALDNDSVDLDNHLKEEDFFDVTTYPTARMEISSVDGNTVTADLTIKDVTKEVIFDIENIDGGATASFSIDSTQWGVGEGWIKDALVSDDIDFDVTLAY